MKRRDILKNLALTAGLMLTNTTRAEAGTCQDDGTPNQFIPKTPRDPTPLEKELDKYPRCPYCGMSRKEHHPNRHLIHYADDLVDGVCSLHCAAISLSINVDRGPKTIYVADSGATTAPSPLVNVDAAVYLIGSSLKGIMSTRSKLAFANRPSAATAQNQHGGELGDFQTALTATYLDMAKDTQTIRKMREERRRKAAGHGHS